MTKKEYYKKYYQDHKERWNEYKKKFRNKNPEKAKEYTKKWRKKDPERFRKYSRDWHKKHPEWVRESKLMREYGITQAVYLDMLERQGRVCKICGTDMPGNNDKNFSVDHNHKTKQVRGLLCRQCNAGLGNFRDSKDILLKAINYLDDTESKD